MHLDYHIVGLGKIVYAGLLLEVIQKLWIVSSTMSELFKALFSTAQEYIR